MKKESKNESKKRAQGTRFAAEAGVSGGGGGFVSELCKNLHYRLARPATSDEVRRISVACGEFRPRRLKQNPAVVNQKCIISDARENFLPSVGLLGAPREPSEHYVEEVANRSRLFTKKSVPGLVVAPF